MDRYDVIIIGAGIAGIAAARELSSSGQKVLVLEKSRGIGGRGSLRRVQKRTADLGLQFVSPGTAPWNEVLREQSTHLKGLELWDERTRSRSLVQTHTEGMNAFIKAFTLVPSERIQVQFSTRVLKLSVSDVSGEAMVLCDPPAEHRARRVLLTAPLPQSLALLPESVLTPSDPRRLELEKVAYGHAFSWIFCAPNVPVPLPAPLWTHCSPEFSGIFDQGAKGTQKNQGVYVAQTSHELSLALWSEPEEDCVRILKGKMAELLISRGSASVSPEALESLSFHRWRYAQCFNPLAQSTEVLGPFILAGDGFGPGSLPGAARAYESGLRAARLCRQP